MKIVLGTPLGDLLFHTAGSAATAASYPAHLSEYLAYLGWPLLAVLVIRRRGDLLQRHRYPGPWLADSFTVTPLAQAAARAFRPMNLTEDDAHLVPAGGRAGQAAGGIRAVKPAP
jgi:hypothetical protein